MRSHSTKAVLVAFALASATAHAAAPNASFIRNRDVSIQNWEAPARWTPPAETRNPRAAQQDEAAAAIQGLGAVRQPLLVLLPPTPLEFVPITPCRLIDTRAGSGFPAGYGPPSMGGGGTQRSFTITGQCGIPAGVQAVSFNFAVWAPTTRGDLRVFAAGGATPNVSTLNWEAGILALANAAVAPMGAGGAITVQIDGPGTVDIFVDVNGYYGPTGSLPSGTADAGAAVNASPFYLYPLTVTLPTGGACLVTSQAQLNLSGSPTSNPYFRIAIKRGGTDGNDIFYGHYFGTLSGSYSTDQSRTSLITVNPNEATQFGCFIDAVNSGDQTGNLDLQCQTSYLCF